MLQRPQSLDCVWRALLTGRRWRIKRVRVVYRPELHEQLFFGGVGAGFDEVLQQKAFFFRQLQQRGMVVRGLVFVECIEDAKQSFDKRFDFSRGFAFRMCIQQSVHPVVEI